MTGANSAVGLRSMAARYLFLDEVDGYPGDVDGEGDPINLAMARTRTFARRKVFMVSTPKITGHAAGSRRRIEESDQRHYWVPCPTCREFQMLKFAQLRWPKGEPEQGGLRLRALRPGDPESPEAVDAAARRVARDRGQGDGKTAGFHLSSLYSPVGWFALGRRRQAVRAGAEEPALLQVFVNTVLGETWTLLGEAPDWQRLYDRREEYKIGMVPRGGLFLTAGVDVQKDRIEVEVVAWGRGKESWSVDYRVFEGDTRAPQVWEKLTGAAERDVSDRESGWSCRSCKMAVDSGYATTEVYEWARQTAATACW